jgi:hypothetical protein
MITLSIGGNGVEFVNILLACVYHFTDDENACNKQLAKTKDLIFGNKLRLDHQRIIREIYSNLRYREQRSQHAAVYQTGYSQFFDVWTDYCSGVSFWPLAPSGPKMDKEIRSLLNNLAHQVNYVLEYYTAWQNADNAGIIEPGQRDVSFIDWVDVDTVYNGDRFCREGVEEPDRKNDDTWFFHLGEGHLKDSSDDNATTQVWPEWMAETFHPKSAGHGASKDLIYLKTKLEVFARRLSGHTDHPFGKYVWMIGDEICYASQRHDSDIYGSYRTALHNFMLDPHFFGWDRFDSDQGGFRTFFLGQRIGTGSRHDCYKGAQISDIHDKIRNAPQHLEAQNKIVILSVGLMDVFLGYDLDKAHRKISNMLHTIFDNDPTAVVLLTHLPMFGIQEQGRSLERKKVLQLVVEFNARLSGLANYFRTRYNRRVLKVSTPLTTWHKQSVFMPNRRGYNVMAWAIAEQLVFAASMDWVVNDYDQNPREPGPAIPGPPKPNLTPARRSPSAASASLRRRGVPDPNFVPPQYQTMENPVTNGTIICTQKRPEGAPEGKYILSSLLWGPGTEGIQKWAEAVGCNATEICKKSIFNTSASIVYLEL